MGRLKTLDEWLDYQENLHFKEIDLGLERVHKVYTKLFPQGVDFKIISVAGTNGKGSTCVFIESIYRQTNIKTGKFTSPHIIDYNERFSIDAQLATNNQICLAFEQIESIRGNTSLTYFEFSTLAALLIFSKEKVDVAILEVGLGGRCDAVNILDCDICIITNISLDHTDYLGNTREKIAFEKAGIMRKNKLCICGDTRAPQAIKNYAKKISAKLKFINKPYDEKINLVGNHQRHNAALAIKAVQELSPLITKYQIKLGIEKTFITGRFQVQQIQGKEIIVDVAHNEAASKVLATQLLKNPQSTIAIFSALADKNIDAIIDTMRTSIDRWLLIELPTPRAIKLNELCGKFQLSDNIRACNNIAYAMNLALKDKQHKRIIIFGSFYIVSKAIKTIDWT